MSQAQYLHTPSRPSPLAQVHLTRPASNLPPQQRQQQDQQQQPQDQEILHPQGLIRDPLFWKRFSTAVHANERPIDLESLRRNTGGTSGTGTTSSSVGVKKENDWLSEQRKEKRRCRALCISITIAVIILIAGATFAGWYFTKVKRIHISF